MTLEATFSQGGRAVRVPGFYDGDGTYRVRFMPDTEGEWTLRTRVVDAGARRQDRRVHCDPPRRMHMARCASPTSSTSPMPTARRISRSAPPATPGPTSRSTLQEETLETLAKARFNKMRMGVFPKDYPFNTNEPLH